MLAGGIGNIRADHVQKGEITVGAKLMIQLGGPAMRIGLGGGAATSMATGANSADLDFASVQRDNPEMERRCQEVIDRCWQLGEHNPILFIHDVGAGGLSNALPELVNDGGRGGRFELREVPNDEPGMSPLEIWCNEIAGALRAGDRAAADLAQFNAICERERCPFAVVGEATEEPPAGAGGRRPGRQPADRHAAGRAARQAAEDAPRRYPRDALGRHADAGRRRTGQRRAHACCATRPWPARAS